MDDSSSKPFILILKIGAINNCLQLHYGENRGTTPPFILTITPRYVAAKTSKGLPIHWVDMDKYVSENAEQLRRIAMNARDRGRNAEILE